MAEFATCPDVTRRHLGVAVGFLFCVGKPVQLRLPGSKNPFPYLRRAFSYARGTHLFVVHSGHVDMDVDTIHEWARVLRDIALDHRRRAMAFPRAVIVETTWTGIHRSSEHEPSRES